MRLQRCSDAVHTLPLAVQVQGCVDPLVGRADLRACASRVGLAAGCSLLCAAGAVSACSTKGCTGRRLVCK